MSLVNNDVITAELITNEVITGSIAYAGTTEVTLTSITVPAGSWLITASLGIESPATTGFIYLTTTSQSVGRIDNSTRSFAGAGRLFVFVQGSVTVTTTTTFLLRTKQTGADVTNAFISAISGGLADPDNAIFICALRIDTA